MGNNSRQVSSFESMANWSLTRAESNVNEKFSYQAIPVSDSGELSENHPGLQQSNKQNKEAVRPAMTEFGCQDSELVAWRIAPRHAGLRIIAEHTGTTAGRSAGCTKRL
jgi:hypothetical protein